MNAEVIYEVAIIDGNNQELLTLTRNDAIVQGITPTEHEINLIKGNLSHFMSSFPNVAKTIKDLQTYTAYFPVDAASRLKDGTAVIMKTSNGKLLSNAIDPKSGKIIRQARLKSGVTPANLALIGWQLVSVITAQKYLTDIDKKLEIIGKDVAEVRRFQKKEFYSEIKTELQHVQSMISGFCSNSKFIQEFEEFYRPNFLDTYKKISKNIKLLYSEIESEFKKFSDEELNGSKIKDSLENFNNKKEELISIINLFNNLIQAQKFLIVIYKIFYYESTSVKTWEKEYENNSKICRELIKTLNEILLEKNEKLGETWAWYEVAGAVALAPAVIIARAQSYAFHRVSKVIPNDAIKNIAEEQENFWNKESEIDKLKRTNSKKIERDIKDLYKNILDITLDYQPSSKKIAFDMDKSNNISNIRYIED